MNCPYCGASIPAGATKCTACGALMPNAPISGASVPGNPPASGAPADAHVRGVLNADALRVAQTEGKIAAIKFVRQKTGLGLAQAKDYVEALEAGRDPGPVAALPPKTGCGTAAAIVVALIGMAVLLRVLLS
jgi:hypothetical protein